ncbi:DUF1774-domain-containing protein [Eremomyces bilateralis CBS 781.70]|uniref:DUF1774-domain-containing protein n=1 Tax=Eremomyces bilateralis CBS 781.70 TaxID=1392243 RepID=A0A6G1FU57_9PEZI|nr:DUF1774-domain-containing protein [Eremomyces bilateralis CBS 781.70]KAF1809293.1 DUF1774-domain-containing protein [Eremomyces bilateralis CBS 781.70]
MPDVNEVAAQVEERVQSVNPFVRSNNYSKATLVLYRIITVVSWVVFVITGVYYTFQRPHEGKYAHRTIWGQNSHYATPFALNSIITSIYWILLLLLQIPYLTSLYSSDDARSRPSAHLAPHFTLSTLLFFGFIHLWTRTHLIWALILLVVNFLNLTSAYLSLPPPKPPRSADNPLTADGGASRRVRDAFRSFVGGNETPTFDYRLLIHTAVLAGPLAFNFVALYWSGAAAVNAHTLAARILANIAIWGILVYGVFHLYAFGDWVLGVSLSVLAASLGVAQFLTHVVAFQWIFAFVIMGVLFVFSITTAVPSLITRGAASDDRERAPLLQGDS